LSHDPEGFALTKSGNMFVSDEYGPSILEVDRHGKVLRTFVVPSNIKPRNSTDGLNYVDSPTTGRQDNRGYEGLAIIPDGSMVYAVLQVSKNLVA